MTTGSRLIGTRFDGRYDIERELGSGGMADVLLATDDTLGRRVAIKVLHERYARDDSFVQRFLREASAAAKLNHPNIVQVYDRGEAAGTYYIAMEFVDGTTLKDVVRERGPLPATDVYDYGRQALQGLRFAHRNGIVHRDVKPHNFMLDASGTVKIADFGIARAGTDAGLTEVGSIVGTAQYLSPEQAQGHAVTAASDLYSLGVVLYELSTGKVPYDGDQPVNVALRQVNDPVPDPREANPQLDPHLARIIVKAMQKDPAHRYATADEFLEDLEAAAAGHAPSAATTTVLPQAHSPAAAAVTSQYTQLQPLDPWSAEEEPEDGTRRRWPWVVLALLVASVAAVGIWALGGSDAAEVEVPDVRGLSVEEARTALREADLQIGRILSEASERPVGTVIAQNPRPGRMAEEGSDVDVRVSAGVEDIEVPSVVGLEEDEARSILGDAGFAVDVVEASSSTVDEGLVISQAPSAGATVEPGSTVSLVVSSGSDTEEVPSLIGLSEDEARSRLRDAGFSVDSTTQDGTAQRGVVLDQSPSAGTAVRRGETVRITVASGSNEVPDVVGQEPQAADQTIRNAGFDVRIVERPSDDPAIPPQGQVSSQDPRGGRRQQVGTLVTLTVQVGNAGE